MSEKHLDSVPKETMTKKELRAIKANSLKARRRRRRILITLLVVVVLAIGALPFYQMVYIPYQADSVYKYAKICYGTTGETLPEDCNEDLGKLYDINSDLNGWLIVPDADIDLPVVTIGNRDRLYYTNHLFDGTENPYGTPYFIDRTPSDDIGSIAVIRGGEKLMGSLGGYRELAFYKKSPLLFFDGLKNTYIYKIFSVTDLKDGDALLSAEAPPETVREIAGRLAENSYIDTGITVNGNDRLLILVCDTEKGKLAIAARAVRENEDYTVATEFAKVHTVGTSIHTVEITATDVVVPQASVPEASPKTETKSKS